MSNRWEKGSKHRSMGVLNDDQIPQVSCQMVSSRVENDYEPTNY